MRCCWPMVGSRRWMTTRAGRPMARARVDGRGLAAVPGFIELQLNGIDGHDFTTEPASIVGRSGPARRDTASRHSSPPSSARHRGRSTPPSRHGERRRATAGSPVPLGVHVEGPSSRPPAPAPTIRPCLRDPDLAEIARWISGGGLRIATLAPEQEGAIEAIARLDDGGVVASIGHTDADAATTATGNRRRRPLCHPPVQRHVAAGHRAPGAPGALLADERVTLGLIARRPPPRSARRSPRRAPREGPGRTRQRRDRRARAARRDASARGQGCRGARRPGAACRRHAGRQRRRARCLRPRLRPPRRIRAGRGRGGDGHPGTTARRDASAGHLAPGARADVVLLDADLRVRMTIVGGVVAHERPPLTRRPLVIAAWWSWWDAPPARGVGPGCAAERHAARVGCRVEHPGDQRAAVAFGSPERGSRRADLRDGDVRRAGRQPAARPVAPAADGGVWYSGQGNGTLGWLDPETARCARSRWDPGSAPHGVITGPDDAAWLTDGGLNAIVRVDPATSEATVYPHRLPDANLNTATFDGDGILWFTGQNGWYGRLDPATGALETFRRAARDPARTGSPPRQRARSAYSSLAGSYLGLVDRASGEVRWWTRRRPGGGAAARLVGLDRSACGSPSGSRARSPRTTRRPRTWPEWPLPGRRPGAVRGVRGRDRCGVGHRLRRQRAASVRPGHRDAGRRSSTPRRPRDVRQLLGRPGEVWGAESAADRLVVVRWTEP